MEATSLAPIRKDEAHAQLEALRVQPRSYVAISCRSPLSRGQTSANLTSCSDSAVIVPPAQQRMALLADVPKHRCAVTVEFSVTLSRMNRTTRRHFVEQCASAAAAAWLLPELARASNSAPSVKFPTDPRARVAVAAYPFREFIVGWKGWDGKSPSAVPAGQQMELKDFAAHVAEKFNVHNIEPWSRIFPSTDRKYLDELRAAVEKAHSAIVDIAVDGENSQYSMDAAERDRAVVSGKEWVDVGAADSHPGNEGLETRCRACGGNTRSRSRVWCEEERRDQSRKRRRGE